jgi:hypothetical protein
VTVDHRQDESPDQPQIEPLHFAAELWRLRNLSAPFYSMPGILI